MTNKKYKLLLIDDDPTLRLIAKKKLSNVGYWVETVGSGHDGIQRFQQQSPDLVLLDYELPDMNGVEVCRLLRSSPGSVEKPILFITGKDDYDSIERAFQAGATDFSSKPLNWAILHYRIRYMLRAHELYLSLQSSEARLKKAHKIAKIANWDFCPVKKVFNWSETLFEMLDSERCILALNDFLQFVPEEDRDRVSVVIRACLSNNNNFEIEHELLTKQGRRKTISHLGNVIRNDAGEVVDYIGTLQDITERREIESQIRKLAYFDSLTGLMNRDSFLKILDKVLQRNTDHGLMSALLFIDLDDFKRVNDTLGHNYGDLLLCEVAERLKNCVRTTAEETEFTLTNNRLLSGSIPDSVFRLNSIDINRFDLCRLGGDEFTVFLTDIINEDIAAKVANRLLKVLENPFILDNHEVFITFSIGIAIAPFDGDSIQMLLKNADTAMYSAKANGKNNYQFYTKAMNERYLYRLTLESDLRNALSNNELYLVYQPQYCMQSERLIGAEVLMRWKHRNKGEIPPDEFIPLAEETGQILSIGDWLFRQCLLDLRQYRRMAVLAEEFRLSINVSSLQFHQSDILNQVKRIFSDIALNRHICFELTETVMMKNAATNLNKLNELAKHNIMLAIDDFGTGYSSLSYLQRFPVDTIKIDRSFIANMKNAEQVNIVKAIIAMAHGMNIKVVAEGIEHQWQYALLRDEACDIAQGFFLARPMPFTKFLNLLQAD